MTWFRKGECSRLSTQQKKMTFDQATVCVLWEHREWRYEKMSEVDGLACRFSGVQSSSQEQSSWGHYNWEKRSSLIYTRTVIFFFYIFKVHHLPWVLGLEQCACCIFRSSTSSFTIAYICRNCGEWKPTPPPPPPKRTPWSLQALLSQCKTNLAGWIFYLVIWWTLPDRRTSGFFSSRTDAFVLDPMEG